MIQIKLIKGGLQELEVQTNQFLRSIGGVPGVRADLKDIKLQQDMTDGKFISMVIYNQVQIQQPPTKP